VKIIHVIITITTIELFNGRSESESYISVATDLAFITYSIMIAKYGISKAETFEIIPKNLSLLNQILMEGNVKSAKEKSDIKKEIAEAATSVWIWYFSSHCKTDLLHTQSPPRHTHKRGLTLDKKSLTSLKVLIILLDLHGKYSLGRLKDIHRKSLC
jgi:DNA mismatch repair ATPase MutS